MKALNTLLLSVLIGLCFSASAATQPSLSTLVGTWEMETQVLTEKGARVPTQAKILNGKSRFTIHPTSESPYFFTIFSWWKITSQDPKATHTPEHGLTFFGSNTLLATQWHNEPRLKAVTTNETKVFDFKLLDNGKLSFVMYETPNCVTSKCEHQNVVTITRGVANKVSQEPLNQAPDWYPQL
ncbi:hypothetical protein [Vibrio nigripulchritudo]|uniref:hypothetical protein n=1 Tax=Vibrio nigripulchritudo TaxID=28173 RepID=UPI0005F9F861|nr:hypothetical protein [Vibrio nigripulchritudo]KJY79654.1 hypothetical protein TW74_09460 [Vibrio nigripulchritudo]